MPDLSNEKIVEINNSSKAMSKAEIEKYIPRIPGWNLIEKTDEPRLERSYSFPNFSKALDFTQQVGQAADSENHHPMICTEWGKVTVSWWTHKVHGLHLNDFIMAARTDQIYHP